MLLAATGAFPRAARVTTALSSLNLAPRHPGSRRCASVAIATGHMCREQRVRSSAKNRSQESHPLLCSINVFQSNPIQLNAGVKSHGHLNDTFSFLCATFTSPTHIEAWVSVSKNILLYCQSVGVISMQFTVENLMFVHI